MNDDFPVFFKLFLSETFNIKMIFNKILYWLNFFDPTDTFGLAAYFKNYMDTTSSFIQYPLDTNFSTVDLFLDYNFSLFFSNSCFFDFFYFRQIFLNFFINFFKI